MPKHSKFKKAKRPWYDVSMNKEKDTDLQRLWKEAMFHSWEIRPKMTGIWVLARHRFRLFITGEEDGTFDSCVLVIAGKGDEFEDEQRDLTHKQTLKAIERFGRLYFPDQ